MIIALSDIAYDTEESLRLVHSCIHSSKQAPANVSSMMRKSHRSADKRQPGCAGVVSLQSKENALLNQ